MESDHLGTGFLDLLFNCLVGFIVLFVISFMLISIIHSTSTADIQTRAEYVVTVTWPNGCSDDVDTWLRDPLGNVVWYRTKEAGFMHLDRDDLGYKKDVLKLGDGTTATYDCNQELTTIRKVIPGEWTLNVHMYAKRDADPTTACVKIEKINPVSKIVLYKKVVLETYWQEVTVARFTMAKDGEILSWDDTYARLVVAEAQDEINGVRQGVMAR